MKATQRVLRLLIKWQRVNRDLNLHLSTYRDGLILGDIPIFREKELYRANFLVVIKQQPNGLLDLNIKNRYSNKYEKYYGSDKRVSELVKLLNEISVDKIDKRY